MNVPNRLTLSRLFLTPVWVLLFFLMKRSPSYRVRCISCILLLILVAYMEISDLLDGLIARRQHLVTDLGKVFDPFSDSLMHLSFFITFLYFNLISFVAFYFILMRELLIVFIRLLLVKCGKTLPANIFGKFKTVFYAVLSIFIILYSCISVFKSFPPAFVNVMEIFFHILSYFACFFSILSFAIYMYQAIKSKIFDALTK